MPRLYFHQRRTDLVLRLVHADDPLGLVNRIDDGLREDVIACADGARYRNERHRSKSFRLDLVCHENSPHHPREQLRTKRTAARPPIARSALPDSYRPFDSTNSAEPKQLSPPTTASARISLLAVLNNDYGRLQGRVTLFVELKAATNAVELDRSKRVTDLRSVGQPAF